MLLAGTSPADIAAAVVTVVTGIGAAAVLVIKEMRRRGPRD